MIKVKVFDFDSTLVEPNGEENDEFMETSESLNFDFKLKKSTLKEYLKASEEEDTILVLLTNRTIKLKTEVIELLERKEITFDYHLFRNIDRSKGNRLSNFIDKFEKEIKEIYFWDDKQKHINDVKRIQSNHNDIKFQLNIVK